MDPTRVTDDLNANMLIDLRHSIGCQRVFIDSQRSHLGSIIQHMAQFADDVTAWIFAQLLCRHAFSSA
jgi:hypothetical protein